MNTDQRHRFPPDIISYVVWLYYRFNLSHRELNPAAIHCTKRYVYHQAVGDEEQSDA